MNEISITYPNKENFKKIVSQEPLFELHQRKKIGNGCSIFNKLIFGDNLQVLKLLSSDSTLKGKIKLIYIDPPFSTNQIFRSGLSRTSTISCSNNDEKAYEDKLVGSAYIEFLRKRFILLRQLLAEDGSIYVHIDSKMSHYVKVLLDEIFGYENFINEITRVKCNPKNFSRKAYGNIKDTILFYSKTSKYVWNDSREDFSEKDIERLFPKIDKKGRRYTTTPLHAPGETADGPTGKPWKGIYPPAGRHWRHSPAELEILNNKGLIEWSSTGNPRKIIFADEFMKKGKKRQDIWLFKDKIYPLYPTEKNLEMLKVIIQASSNPDDIVLDCFAGSGSTLSAAQETNRHWIGIDCSKIAIETGFKRLSSISGCNFIYYEIRNRKNYDEKI